MSNKEDNFKEQFKQALISTAKVISEDYKLDEKKIDKNLKSKKIDFFDITNLSNKNDFVRLRAETDSGALKKKFSNKEIFNKNLPSNPSCKLLYNTAEKIRYEILGGKMLKGVGKNLSENYTQKIGSIRKNQLKGKEDVSVSEAFELYMLKKFFNIELNDISSKMLSFWEKDFSHSIDKHLDFLNKNLEDQNNYSLKFS
jgi:cobaltochelatase CobT